MYRFSGITVKELLKLSSMKDSIVLAGDKGLNRNITRLNVMEVPDIVDWVGEGEFLLTAAYSMKDNIDELDELIVKLNKKGVAGLGVKTKRYIEKIPKASLEKAEMLGFPLVEIPFDISYSTILTEGLTEIVNAHTNILFRISNIQNSLIKLMLDGGSLKEIALAIHENFDGSTIVIKEYIMATTVMFSCNNEKEYMEKLIEHEDIKRRENYKNISLDFNYTKSTDRIDDKEITRFNIPIYSDNIEYGCIYIWEDKRKISLVEIKVIESSTPIIALDIHKKMSILEMETKGKAEFLNDLFSGQEDRIKKSMEKLSYLDFDINSSYSVIIVHIKQDAIYNDYKNNAPNYINQLKIRILSIIEKISQDENINTLSTTRNNGVVILFGSKLDKKQDMIKKDIRKFIMKVLNFAEHENFNEYLYVGIGRNFDNSNEIWVSNEEALKVIDYQENQAKDKVLFYEDLGIYKILSFDGLEAELNLFYNNTLNGLVDYDREKGTDLIITLKKYFEFEGNLKKISEKMFVHYNTVVYRLQRIEEITNMDLDKYEHRLNLQIALEILNMSGK